MRASEHVEQAVEHSFPQVKAASYIAGTGLSVPDNPISNDYFASYLETSDEWIRDRTGISNRYWVDDDTCASELSEAAARTAIQNAGLQPSDLDGIIVGTVTPDYSFPSTACRLQHRLGIKGCLAYDVTAVCSGFLYAFVNADALIASGMCRNVLVVGVDFFSTILDKNDRSTIVLFGDGAGAVVLSAACPEGDFGSHYMLGDGGTLRGVLASELGADGEHGDLLACKVGTAARLTPELLAGGGHWMTMEGREVFKHATRKLAAINRQVCEKAGFEVEQVDYFVTHQANKRIVEHMAKQLHVPQEKVLVNVDRYGNTSAASVPILLAEAEGEGIIKRGDLVMLSAFGAGFTWGASLVRW